ncbi:MAG: hypothetical protein U0V74_10680 [Chitinophagales bacterium]
MVLLVACGPLSLWAMRDSTITNLKRPDYFIDDEQQRIDLLDGTLDKIVDVGDSAETIRAGKVYLTLIDSIQRFIDNSGFEEGRKKVFREHVYLQLRKVGVRNYYNVRRYDNLFHFILAELNGIKQKKLYTVLTSNIGQSFNTLGLFKNESCADSFLIFAAAYRPDLVFKSYDVYYNKNYTLHVVEEASKIAPVTVKRYFVKGNGIYETLKASQDTVVKTLLKIREKYNLKTNAYALIDEIANGNLTIEQANAIGESPEKYLHAMLKIRSKANPLGIHSLEDDLEIYSLKFVRVLNDLHNDKDEVRFASIENFSAEELYTMMVYSEEEIFTSTFNGLFKRMMIKLGPISGFEFLGSVGDNRFRTFIKMAAGFGKLGPFLQSMTPVHQQMLMIKFASKLEKYNDLSQAVEVADAFGSITDSLVLKILRGAVKYEYVRLSGERNEKGKAIYGLLSNLFVERNISNENWFASVAKQYQLPSFDKIENTKLCNRDSVSRWMIYFYDDEDGEASFSSFVKTFNDTAWRVIDSSIYVIIESKKGKPVQIYANKNKNEYDGQAKLESIFADNNWDPNVMVHRGHSYYAYKTIEKIHDNTQVFVLGSCGGYHSLSTIIERSPDISIISSKQIGTMFVNNPMLKLLAEKVRLGKDVEWQGLWDELGKAVKDNSKAFERYQDYIPPHKNLGAIFIKTYNRLMESE